MNRGSWLTVGVAVLAHWIRVFAKLLRLNSPRNGRSVLVQACGLPLLLTYVGCGSGDDPRTEARESVGETRQALCTGTTFTTSPVSPIPLNANVQLTTTAACGSAVPEYRFLWQMSGSEATTTGVIREWGPSNSYTWSTAGLPSGSYNLYAYARSTGGDHRESTLGLYKVLIGRVCNSTTLALSPEIAPLSSPPIGTPITFTPTATCTHAGTPEYQIHYIPLGQTPLPDYVQVRNAEDPPNTWYTTPPTLDTTNMRSGKYSFQVRTRAVGNDSVYESSASAAPNSYIGDVCPKVVLTASPASPRQKGTAITLTAAPTCLRTAVPEYRFSYKLTSALTYEFLGDWSPSSTAVWNTAALVPGDYSLQVYVRGQGNQSPTEGYAVIPFTVQGLPVDPATINCPGSPTLNYRPVTFARDLTDLFTLPTPNPPATPITSPVFKRANRFAFNVPIGMSVSMAFNIGNTTLPSNPSVGLTVYNANGGVIKTATLPSNQTAQTVTTTVAFGNLAGGNYELELQPQNEALTYTVRPVAANVTVALKDGVDLTGPAAPLYFFVPAEVETAFLTGNFDAANLPRFFSPTGPEVTPHPVCSGVWSFDTRGNPGVWSTTFRTTSEKARFVNLPDLLSFDPKSVLASKRIRTAMASATGGAATAITSPNLKYNNRFSFHLTSTSTPTFTIGTGTSVGNPLPISVSLLDSNGTHLTGSPFSIVPGSSPPALITAGQLSPGDYELHVTNPALTNTYSITVPPGIPFVSVDGYGLGSVWLASYYAFFTVPADTPAVRFAAKPASDVPITVYSPTGVAPAPTPLGNNVYEFPIPTAFRSTATIWAINLKGESWSDIRLLNVPQIIAFNKDMLQTVAPGGITTCSTNADCPTGKVCGSDNGEHFGLSATADVCWSIECPAAEPSNLCGNVLSLCGTCVQPTPCEGDNACPTTNPDCTDSGVCPAGLQCPEIPNGWRFALPSRKICEAPDCCADQADIGTRTPECGLCTCRGDCSTKQCGDADLSDGCGGQCLGVCEPGENGCQRDADCSGGHLCRAAICVPADVCGRADLQPPLCGPGSLCGPCAPESVATCADRECGVDPETGGNCGSCTGSSFCNSAGRCAQLDTTPVVEVPRADGGTRVVMPGVAPPAPAVFGATPGAFAVTERGSASYSIPIEVPPGRAGVEPNLAIRYTSSTGNGALGIGWSLDGFSNITRCARTYAQDGFARSVKGDSGDALCLDGQRLVKIADGTYRTQIETFSKIVAVLNGADEPEWFKVYTKAGSILSYGSTKNARGRLKGAVVGTWALDRQEDRSGNFLRIVYDQTIADAANKVSTSTAEMVPTVVTYTGHGNTDGDREVRFIYDTNRGDQFNGFRVGGGAFSRTQILRSIDVRASNALVRRYSLAFEESINEAQRLKSIQECAGTTLSSCRKPTQFSYYDETGFAEGGVMPIPNEVGRSVPPPFVANGMVHKAKDGRDLLTVLIRHSAPYITTPIPLGVSQGVALVPTVGPYASIAIDIINIFGQEEKERLTYESFTWDMFNDERLLGVYTCGGRNAPLRQLEIMGGRSAGAERIRDTCPRRIGSPLLPSMPRQWLTDLNGDGVQDLLYCAEELDTTAGLQMHLDYRLARPTVSGNLEPPEAGTHAQRDGEVPLWGSICNPFARQQFSMILDLDSNGTGDLVSYDDSAGWAALMPTEASFAWEPVAGLDIDPNYKYYVAPIDANGDGLRDLLGLPFPPAFFSSLLFPEPPRTPVVAINTGRGFEQRNLTPLQDGSTIGGGASPRFGAYVLDIDQDGVEELVFADPDANGEAAPWRIGRVRGGAFLNDAIPSLVEGPGVLGDFDGDGDIDAFTQATTYIFGQSIPRNFRFHSGVGKNQNLLKTVTDGAGHMVQVAYSDTNALGKVYSLYSPILSSEDCNWPQRCVSRTDHALVSQHVELHFENQERTSPKVDRVLSYQYEGARLDTAGYGWLGFSSRKVEVTDGDAEPLGSTTIFYEVPDPWVYGTTTVPYFYTRAGLQKSRIEVAPPVEPITESPISSVLSQTSIAREFTYTPRTSASGRPFIFLSRAEATTYDRDLDSSPNTIPMFTEVGTTDVDAYGNATEEVTTRTDWRLHAGIPVLEPNSRTVDRTTVVYEPTAAEIEAWLINLPKSVTTYSSPRCSNPPNCNERDQERTTSIIYHDGTNLPRFVTRESTDASLQVVTGLLYDIAGNVERTAMVDGYGNVREARVTFDSRRLFPTSTSVVGDGVIHTTQLDFDDRFGELTVRADPNGIDETWSFDAFGVNRRHTGPGGVVTSDYAPADYYEVSGFPIPAAVKVITAKVGGGRTEQEVNSFGQVVRRKTYGLNGAEVFEEFGYDSRQRLRIQHRPHLQGDSSQGQIEYGYDEIDRLVSEDYPDGAHVQHDHAKVSTLVASLDGWRIGGAQHFVQSTDPNGHKTLAIHDRDGQIIGVVDAQNYLTRHKYTAFGQLEEIEDALERRIRFQHDSFGRLKSVTDDARGGTELTLYNGLDEVILTSDAAGRVQIAYYDEFGRIEALADDDGTTEWRYDGSGENEAGRLVETVSSSGQIQTFGYEPRDNIRNRGLLTRTTSELLPVGAPANTAPRILTTQYQFDSASRLEQIDYPATTVTQTSVKYEFDAFGHTIKALNPASPAQIYWQLVAADQGLRVQEERLGTHACGSVLGSTTKRSYEALTGRQETIKTQCGSQVLQDLTYDYDFAGNLSARFDAKTGVHEVFGHDELNRLSTVSPAGVPPVTRYTYDDGGRGRLTWQAEVGDYEYELNKGRDWIKSAGGTTYEHDLVGNIINRSGAGVPGGAQVIEYTAFDLPKKITSAGSATDFAYDASGSRAVKQGPAATTFYAATYQRTETSATDAAHRFMVYAGGRAVAQLSNTQQGSTTSAMAVRYLHDDYLGSVHVVSDASGAIATTRSYSPFGQPGGAVTETPYGFTGHESDEELGLINMRGRMYDPSLGQFMSADPIMQQPYGQGLNRFAYVNNSPLNFVDPSGFERKPRDPDDERGPELNGRAGFSGFAALGAALGAAASAAGVAELAAGASAGFVAGGAIATATGTTAAASPAVGAAAATPAIGMDNFTAGVASIIVNHSLGQRLPTRSSGAEGSRTGGGRNGGAQGRGAGAPDAYAPVQEKPANLSLFAPERGALAAVPCRRSPEECRQMVMDFNLSGGGIGPGVVIKGAQGTGSLVVRFVNWLLGRGAARGAGAASKVLGLTPKNLQKFFGKHGSDFGLSGNWNPSRAADASRVINQHINSPSVRAIEGAYRGNPATHFLDPKTGLNVVADPAGKFITGYRLDAVQLEGVLTTGHLF